MSRLRAEGRTCEICGRRMLAGEHFAFLDDPGRRKHRRPVCALCQRDALARGWTRTIDLPPPELPRHFTEPDQDTETRDAGADSPVQ